MATTSAVNRVPFVTAVRLSAGGTSGTGIGGVAQETTLQSLLDRFRLGSKPDCFSLSVTPTSSGFYLPQLPTTLGPQSAFTSLSVTPCADGFPVTIENGATDDMLEAVRSEIESLKSAVLNVNVVSGNQQGNNSNLSGLGPQVSMSSVSVTPSLTGFAVQATMNQLPTSLGQQPGHYSLSVVPSASGFPVQAVVNGVAQENTLQQLVAKLPSLGLQSESNSLPVVISGVPEVSLPGVARDTTVSALLVPFTGPQQPNSSLSVVPNDDGFAVQVDGVSQETTLQSLVNKIPSGQHASTASLSVIVSHCMQ